MENHTLDIKDYLKIIKRRRKFLYIPFLLIALISLLLAVLLPSIFRSTSTILIEAQEIPSELVRSTVTTFADQRIQVISQRIMTRPNLTEIIKKYDLYADDRKKKTEEVILEKMRKSIKVETISADVADHRSGASAQATIAFTLTFDDKSPALAQKVANELTSLFLKENIKSRTESAENAALFLSEESKRLKAKIQEIQNSLATFKERNLNQLPQISALNQQELTSLSNQLLSLDSQERSLNDRRFYLEGELAQIDPNAMASNAAGNRVFDMKDRLKELQSQYPSVLSSHSPNHPDVIKIKREIESLQKEIGSNSDINAMNAELTDKKAELALLLKQYSEKHPDIQKLQKQISALQQSLVDAKQSEYTNTTLQPDNPAFITLKSQLDSVKTEIESLNYTRGQIKAKMEELRNSLRQAPLVEKEYTDLLQELDNTNIRYREVSAREMEAQISQQLEMERKGERFTLIDPPQEPLEPVSPNRIAILILGLLVAVCTGFGAVALAEIFDPTINGPKAVTAILGMEPLAAIPYLESETENKAQSNRRKLLLIGCVAAGLLAAILFHMIIMPLDVFWYKLLRVIGNQ
ncbi:lipopolysaccharide biosynthesis protein [Methylomonas koyamae]|uniref:Lipopolysaccharide biosynthesis protein n=1 Tax=Methylomonas koyamae TaxID=702114 RepID=A0A177NEA4_9GAMM|nr:lipopolysaccharide biosynthesis protein [Methylomonas koyamae]ATG90575.1 lipopolysaccharide biosynthesis protein [Methylomonas koyamae]OAI16162.1 lipopolysaccharide biosynthesis protein [Methylomonas koyamae]OAI30027.1 lipopolysaccharide biosynthesis protein [Methylomonas koyamae]WNB73884.1 lipopolysaccharide biosynthesis protein [Methylomonas koyamae]